MDSAVALTVFDALSQPTRLEVVRLLVRVGPEGLPAGEIGDRLGVRQNTMSANLKVLAQARLVRSHRDGRVIRYSADLETLKDLMQFMLHDCCGGRPEVCGIAPLTCGA